MDWRASVSGDSVYELYIESSCPIGFLCESRVGMYIIPHRREWCQFRLATTDDDGHGAIQQGRRVYLEKQQLRRTGGLTMSTSERILSIQSHVVSGCKLLWSAGTYTQHHPSPRRANLLTLLGTS